MKKLALTLLLSLSIIGAQAGAWKTIREVISTAVIVEASYIALKWAYYSDLIKLPHIEYN